MSGLALALAMFAASGSSHFHFIDPFDTYMSGVEAGQPGRELSGFAAECRVSVVGVESTYGLDGEQVKSLAKAVKTLEKDDFTTFQVWKSRQQRFVVIWSYDLEQEYRSSFCFADDGTLRFEDVRSWLFELPSGKGWSHLQRWVLDSSGRLVAQPGHFLSMDGKSIPKPKLDADEEKNLGYHEDIRKISDLKLPPSMLR
jgi:hypothetical protein